MLVESEAAMFGEHGSPETYRRGKAFEALGLKMLSSMFPNAKVFAPASGSVADKMGADVMVGGMPVDIKALKKHAPEQILVEYRNVGGGDGCSTKTNGAVLIFVSETEAVYVEKKYLALLINDPRKFNWNAPAGQQPREFVENFTPYSRPGRKDRVAYIPYAQLMRLLSSRRVRWNAAAGKAEL